MPVDIYIKKCFTKSHLSWEKMRGHSMIHFLKHWFQQQQQNSSKYVWIQFSANGRCNLKVFFFFTTHITSILKVVKWSASKPNFQIKKRKEKVLIMA